MSRTASGRHGIASHPVTYHPLSDLHFDLNNPRLGAKAGQIEDETDILDFIVENLGIEDVLSSIAVNGYLDSEPLVGVATPKSQEVRVAEGNRRLAACLILAGDPRAKNQRRRRQVYAPIHRAHGSKEIDPLPVIIYHGKEELDRILPYLGVRHISGALQWDSFAKAAWVARVLDEHKVTLHDIIQMIGDEHGTSPRMLQGYYLVNQLIDAGRFDPRNSRRPGRGSNPDYPFSWVYTALGYGPIRRWLELPEDPKKKPVPTRRLGRAEQLMNFLFGNKEKSLEGAVPDSRDISDLALAVEDPEQLALLESGKNVREVKELRVPPAERLTKALVAARTNLERCLGLIGQESIDSTEAVAALDLSRRVRSLAIKVAKELQATASVDGADGDE